jgi:uncharacterized secreted protein with C-terminal beta-propeller domain
MQATYLLSAALLSMFLGCSSPAGRASEQNSATNAGASATGGATLAATSSATGGSDAGSGGAGGSGGTTLLVAVPLSRVQGCEGVSQIIRERTRQTMNVNMDAIDTRIEHPVSCSSGGARSIDTGTNTSAPTSISVTNNQVASVDEADLVKTDGLYIYLARKSELDIVSAWPADQTHSVATLPLGGTAKKLFVVDDRVLVYVSQPRSSQGAGAWYTGPVTDCTYGYDCDFTGDGTATDMVVIDVSNRAAPKEIRRLNLAGSLIAARRIGSTVHTVVSVGQALIPNLVTPTIPYGGCTPLTDSERNSAHAAVAAARDQNNVIIDAAEFQVGPLMSEAGVPLSSSDCSQFYQDSAGDGTAITSLVALDMLKSESPQVATIVSRGGAVYASANSLYMSVSHDRSKMSSWYVDQGSAEASTVHRFHIDQNPTDTAYLASGIVPGRVLNQFSMDEYEGDLRIATTTGHVPDPSVTSTLSVLRQDGSALNVVGQITGIAPTEDIRSVRFDQTRGYLVSFKKTDPLFVLDLSQPTAPSIVGELKIPGFSTYLHLLDKGHLLALGYEADDQGTFAYFNGIQLQVFDVTSATEPTLLHKKVYGTRGSSSSALTNHLGFTFLADRGLLALPMSICDGGGNGQFGKLSFSGVVALDVSVSGGINELGRLEEPYPAGSATFYYGAACQDWWTSSNSVVSRTVVLDDFLYAISADRVRVQDLNQLGVDVALVSAAP